MRVHTFFRRKNRGIRGKLIHRAFGFTVMWRGEERVVWRKCGKCSGGVQVINPVTERWGPIPLSLRREQGDRLGYPQANIRDCRFCHGIGKHWIAKKE